MVLGEWDLLPNWVRVNPSLGASDGMGLKKLKIRAISEHIDSRAWPLSVG